MEYKYSISIAEQKRMFLFGYYNRPILWFQRRFFGPTLIVLGILSLILNNNTESFIMIVLFILFGIYMILRPLIFLARIKFTNSDGKIIIENNSIQIINEKGELKIDRGELIDVFKKKHYLFLKARLHTVDYYSFDLNGFIDKSETIINELLEMKTK
jgi:hypothetical protein